MLKHIGRHGDRKVAILFREVPGEDHMCLVIYPETLPTHIHDSIMKTWKVQWDSKPLTWQMHCIAVYYQMVVRNWRHCTEKA